MTNMEYIGCGGRVLVVDDDEDIREVVDVILSGEGYEVLAAPNGAAALRLLEQAGQEAPDVILLDMRMPVMDGWAFARAYRAMPAPRSPIIVITAAPDAPTRAREIGADGFLGKPFDVRKLLAQVERFARPKAC